jgi:hypothetical protein
MGKNQSSSNLTNIIKQDANGNISFVSGSTTLMSVSSSGAIETTGNVAGTASYASNAELFNGLDSTVFATTGSNTFAGIQTVNSNLIVTGSITAQTLVVQTITSSVDFVTGSTRFGSLSSDTHVFTGSVNITGSTNLAGSLTVNKVAINSGNLNLASFPSLDLIVSGGIGFSSGGSGAAALVNRDGSGNTTFYGGSGDIKFTDLTMTSNYLTIKNAGNVGIGVIPSAWYTGYTALQVGFSGAIWSNKTSADTNTTMIGNNAYLNSGATNWIYQNNGFATRYTQVSGEHQFYTTASGTAGAAITWTQAMTLNSSGNLGIGTSSPSTLLHLSSTSTQLTLQNTDGGGNAERVGMFMTGGDTFKLISLNDNNTTRVDNILVANVLNGNVGIGTSSPNYKFEIGTVTPQFSLASTSATGYNEIYFHRNTTTVMGYIGVGVNSTVSANGDEFVIQNSISGGNIVFRTNRSGTVAERMRMDSNGVLKIGNGQTPDDGRNPGYANVAITYNNTSGYGEIQCLHQGINVYTLRLNNAGGQVYAGTSRLDNISDIRMKTDITSLGETLEIINQLQPKKFHLIDEKNGKLRYGFIAQELEGILDDFVYNSDIKYKDEENNIEIENIKGIENWASSWAALLIKGMQEQQIQIQELNTKLDAANVEIEALKNK